MQYKIHISDRTYSSWEIESIGASIPTLQKHPFESKLFHEDVFEIDSAETPEIKIVNSKTRESKFIAGVLILEKNKTYGRTPNKKRLYYSCIPHDKHLPSFLVPYDIDIGFEKVFPNKYVLFRFDHWNPTDKHPYGLLVETIGDVTNLYHYDIYHLYAKQLYRSHKNVQKKIQLHMKNTPLETCIQEIQSDTGRFGTVDDRTKDSNTPIFSIDPWGCTDRDDALSIQTVIPDHKYQVSVYIANVAIWIEYFQLYDFLQETNISTIYLHDHTHSMLPTALSEKICSLDSTHPCFAIAMDFEIDILAKTVQVINIQQCLIRVKRNFDYDSSILAVYPQYKTLLHVTQTLHPDIQNDSHALVAFWMMQMNQEMARELHRRKTGIFRISSSSPNNTPKSDTTTDIFLHIWENSISGKYVGYSQDITDYSHCVIGVPLYIHFTSPIRRMVDIYNQMAWISIQEKTKNLQLSTEMIDKINNDTKTIRKIQMESTILRLVTKEEPLQCKGQIIQIEENKILVYFPEYKCMFSCKNDSSSSSNNKLVYKQMVDCKLYVFERESDYRKKIKIDILGE